MICDHRRAVHAVLAENVIKDVISFIPRKIHINIRRVLASRIQETLKEQIVFDRVHVGNAQTITGQTGSRRAASASPRRLAHNIGHDQKVWGKAFIANQTQLIIHALADAVIHLAVAPKGTAPDLLFQIALGVFPIGTGKGSKNKIREF